MAADFSIKQGDTKKDLTATLLDANGTAVNITGATVKFHMTQVGDTVAKVNAAASIVLASAGTVKYVWVTGDTDTIGDFYGEWEVTFADLTILTFPNDGYFTIAVFAELA